MASATATKQRKASNSEQIEGPLVVCPAPRDHNYPPRRKSVFNTDGDRIGGLVLPHGVPVLIDDPNEVAAVAKDIENGSLNVCKLSPATAKAAIKSSTPAASRDRISQLETAVRDLAGQIKKLGQLPAVEMRGDDLVRN